MNNLKDLLGARLFLLDMDGTLYLGDDVFPGAVDFIQQGRCGFRRTKFLCNVQNDFFQFLPRSRQIDNFIHVQDSPLSVFAAGLPSRPHGETVPVLFPLRFPLPAV